MRWAKTEFVAVVVAQQFNPTAISHPLLERLKIVAPSDPAGPPREDSLLEGSIFSDMVVQAKTTEFHLVVLPPQLQFAPLAGDERKQQLLVEKLGALIKELPHTPYKAIGLNFQCFLDNIEEGTGSFTKSMFYQSSGKLYQSFNSDDARFGAYFSKDYDGFRMKLDIKPVSIDGVDRVLFAFNFHCDLSGEKVHEQLVERLHHWNSTHEEVQRVISTVNIGGNRE